MCKPNKKFIKLFYILIKSKMRLMSASIKS